MKIRDTDRGFKDLVKRAKLNAKISVGIHGAEGDETKVNHEGEEVPVLTVLQVAQWLEFGTATQEARPFIRGWFDENEDIAREAVSRMARLVLEGKISRDAALEKLGLFFVGKIQARMAAGLSPGNKDSTIKKKGSDKAGIDTGQVRSSIRHHVEL